MDLNSKIKQITEETRFLLSKHYNDDTGIEVFITPQKNLIKLEKFDERDYDDKTIEIINLLLNKYENNEDINDVDICVLNKLLLKEINYKQIENEIDKCKKDFCYFANNYIQIKNKSEEGGYFIDKGMVFGDKVKYRLYGIHKYLSDCIDKYQYICGVKSRQIGFTTNVGVKCLHKIIFENNKTILVISKAFEEAKKTLEEWRFMYINLPFFLRRTIFKDNMSQLSLGNKYNYSSIEVKTSGKRSGRSVAATQLIIDEAEFISDVDSLQAAAAPTLSSTKGKCIVLSTPYKQKSQFYNLVDNIINGNNEQKLVVGHWSFIPGRDSDQYNKQIALLNNDPEKIKTEMEIQQITTSDHFIDHKYLQNEKKKIPINNIIDFFSNGNNTNIKLIKDFLSNYDWVEFYDYPEFNVDVKNKFVEYLLSVDPYEGANDSHGIAIFKLNVELDESSQIFFGQDILALGKTKKEELMGFIIDCNNLFPNLKILIERNKGYKYISELSNFNNIKLVKEISINKSFEYSFNDKYGLFLTEYVRKKILNLVYDFVIENYESGIESLLVKECFGLKYKSRRVEGENGDDVIFAVGMGLLYLGIISDIMEKRRIGINVEKMKEYIFFKNIFDVLLFGTDKQNDKIYDLIIGFNDINNKSYSNKEEILSKMLYRDKNIISKDELISIIIEKNYKNKNTSLVDFFNFINL